VEDVFSKAVQTSGHSIEITAQNKPTLNNNTLKVTTPKVDSSPTEHSSSPPPPLPPRSPSQNPTTQNMQQTQPVSRPMQYIGYQILFFLYSFNINGNNSNCIILTIYNIPLLLFFSF
jgi:hypothetical protein